MVLGQKECYQENFSDRNGALNYKELLFKSAQQPQKWVCTKGVPKKHHKTKKTLKLHPWTKLNQNLSKNSS